MAVCTTVIGVKEDSEDRVGLCSESNYVRIRHEDGTVADYLHIRNAGALVEEGDRVDRGDSIAESGLTGCTGGLPHLHFVVWATEWYEYGVGKDSLPISFNNSLPRIDWALKHLKEYQAE